MSLQVRNYLTAFKIRVSSWCAPPRYSGEKTLSLLLLHFRTSLHSLAYVFFPPSKQAIALFHFLLPCHISPDSSSSSSNYKDPWDYTKPHIQVIQNNLTNSRFLNLTTSVNFLFPCKLKNPYIPVLEDGHFGQGDGGHILPNRIVSSYLI